MHPHDVNDQDHIKQEMESYRFGLGAVLIFVFTIGRSVQIFSRIPGTSGAIFVLAWLGSFIAQAWYYQVNVDASGTPDLIAIEWMLLIQAVFFLVGLVILICRQVRGEEVDPFVIGTSIFSRLLPNIKPANQDAASDMIVAAGLSLFFFALDSPIQGGWYRAMLFWMLIGHLWLAACERIQSRRLRNAQRRAAYWSRRLPR